MNHNVISVSSDALRQPLLDPHGFMIPQVENHGARLSSMAAAVFPSSPPAVPVHSVVL